MFLGMRSMRENVSYEQRRKESFYMSRWMASMRQLFEKIFVLFVKRVPLRAGRQYVSRIELQVCSACNVVHLLRNEPGLLNILVETGALPNRLVHIAVESLIGQELRCLRMVIVRKERRRLRCAMVRWDLAVQAVYSILEQRDVCLAELECPCLLPEPLHGQ